jgi:hypothetical protein
LKGFRSHFHSPFLDFSWRYRNELPPRAYPGRGSMGTATQGSDLLGRRQDRQGPRPYSARNRFCCADEVIE